jgi:hypothetical protein
MKTLLRFTCMIVTIVTTGSLFAKPLTEQELSLQVEQLKKEYQRQQSLLERATEERWAARQNQIEIKERNK